MLKTLDFTIEMIISNITANTYYCNNVFRLVPSKMLLLLGYQVNLNL